jgi:hypothetical protein
MAQRVEENRVEEGSEEQFEENNMGGSDATREKKAGLDTSLTRRPAGSPHSRRRRCRMRKKNSWGREKPAMPNLFATPEFRNIGAIYANGSDRGKKAGGPWI